MSKLFNILLEGADSFTANGALTYSTSGNAIVDLFYRIGGSRGKANELTTLVETAFRENARLTVMLLFWARDVRGGAGERQLFRDLIKHLVLKFPSKDWERVIAVVPEVGRWDDLQLFIDTPQEEWAIHLWASGIATRHGLACKWAPRKGPVSYKLQKIMGLTPRQYRKLVVSGTNVVETAMCSGDWNSIDMEKVPSLASIRYNKAFLRRVPEKMAKYVKAVERGEAKVNAAAVYPYDIIAEVKRGDGSGLANQRWKSLPDYVTGDGSVLPMVDVSESMSHMVPGSSVNVMDVAVSLGIYLAHRNEGEFKNELVSFTDSPRFYKVVDDVKQAYRTVMTYRGYSTNVIGAYEEILKRAKQHNLKDSDLPRTVIMFSDMQFNTTSIRGNDATALNAIRDRYRTAGYTIPKLVFWNLAAAKNVPAKYDAQGVLLVSGFSPSMLKTVLSGAVAKPIDAVLDAVWKERYWF